MFFLNHSYYYYELNASEVNTVQLIIVIWGGHTLAFALDSRTQAAMIPCYRGYK